MGGIISGRQMDSKPSQLMLWVAGLGIALMIGLRFEVGADWESYLRIFQRASYGSLGRAISEGDPAFQMINWLVADLGGPVWVVNLICASVFTWGLIRFCLGQPIPWLALTIAVPYLVIVVAMGYTRQGAALGLILAGLADFFRRESILRFAAYVAVAATFHATAVLPFLLVATVVGRNRVVTFIGIAALGVLFYNLFLSASIERFYGVYMKIGYSSQGALIRVLMIASAGALFFAIGRRTGIGDVEYRVWRNFAFASIGAVIALAISPSSTAVDRVAIYLLPLQVAIFARFPLLSRRNDLMRLIPISLFGVVQFVWLTYAAHARLWLPYEIFSF